MSVVAKAPEEAPLIGVRVRTTGGEAVLLAAEPGKRLMEVIRDSDVPIRAECGGVCACATCHVYVERAWFDLLPPPDENEMALLEVAEGGGQLSRLSCQIRLTGNLDGLEVTMAPGSA